MSVLAREWLLDDVRRRFGLSGGNASDPRTIGAEVELIPLHAENCLPVSINSHTTACSLDIVRKLAARNGWTEVPNGNDPPSWTLEGGARVSFEPGGQLEVSSAPHTSASALITELTETCSLLSDGFERHGVILDASGVDPCNPIERTPLQLHRDRYESMTRYFESIGPSGIRMMRQTASVQINLQPGKDPLARWSLLNRLSPLLIAIFANSCRYSSIDTGQASYRAHLWRTLDPSRTGVVTGGDPVESYCDFALHAGSMFKPSPEGTYRDFQSAIEDGATQADWDLHVSTLFPEIRPKGYFEIRSPDMVDVRWIAAPIGIVASVCYDETTARAASDLLQDCDEAALVLAGEVGLHDPVLAATAKDLCELALRGCESLGLDYLRRDDLDTIAEFIDRYTANGNCPADES